VLVLLPPSEGKASPARGAPLDLAALSFPALNPHRERLIRALVALGSSRNRARARAVLGLPPGLDGELDRDAALLTSPAAPAAEVYTGVLYEALGLATLDRGARARAHRRIVTVSALWGAVRPGDRIPAYRLAADVRLPRVGGLAPFWRAPLGSALEEAAGTGLLLDLRSSPYAALWRPTGAVAERTVGVRVIDPATGKVVSHFNKATKGRLVRALLEAKADPRTERDLVHALRELGFAVEPGGRPGALDVAQVV
jgi:hypothetical protein